MAEWTRKLPLKDVWNTAENGLSVQQVAEVAAARLRAMRPHGIESLDDERIEIAEDLEDLAKDPDADKEDFNYIMDRLYDWADTPLDDKWNGRKACWIETI